MKGKRAKAIKITTAQKDRVLMAKLVRLFRPYSPRKGK